MKRIVIPMQKNLVTPLTLVIIIYCVLVSAPLLMVQAQTTEPATASSVLTDPNGVPIQTMNPQGNDQIQGEIQIVQPSELPSDAAAPTPPTTDSVVPVQELQTTDTQGEIVSVAADRLTIDADGSVREFTVPQSVLIKRNGSTAELSELKPGDSVTVRQSPTGVVLSVDATAASVMETGRWLVPTAIIGLLAVAALAFFIRKSSTSHIKTTAE